MWPRSNRLRLADKIAGMALDALVVNKELFGIDGGEEVFLWG